MAKAVNDRSAATRHYELAKAWICRSPYVQEIEWQQSLHASNASESQFLREYAWVVLNSGFRESVVRRRFDYISLCFCDWESAEVIETNGQACVESAFAVFRNRRKLNAIVETARRVSRCGFLHIKSMLDEGAVSVLCDLPFIGPVTMWHLAKNLGVDVAKPDRHLVRLARRFGYDDVNRMCRDIQAEAGDRVAVVDLVLWRFEEQLHSQAITCENGLVQTRISSPGTSGARCPNTAASHETCI